LPEVEMLIDKMTSTLSVNNVDCLDAYEELPVDSIDWRCCINSCG
jgi:hypothetical protein